MRALIVAFSLWSAHAGADAGAFALKLDRTRDVQTRAHTAYVASSAMTTATMELTLKAVDEATVLMRDVAQDPNLSEDERGRLYEEILRGDPDDERHGSLARLFWSTITHHGADDVDNFGDDESNFRIFRQTFYEVFLDLKSLVTYRRDAAGRKLWTARDRYNRERIARGLTVRFVDLLFTLDRAETRSEDALDYGYDAVHLVAKTAVELRRERIIAERLAATFYAGMVVANLFAPMILPFVQFNWVGLVTGGAWGSAPLSGASYLFGYAASTLAKLFTGTGKTYHLLRDLERVAADPGTEPSAKARYQTFRAEVLAGRTPLGRHRARMVKRGYRPDDLGAMTCADRLGSMIL